MYGNHGKIMHIYLNKREFKMEKLPSEVYKKYIGGKGLGIYLLDRELDPGVEPLSSGNKLIFCTGPLTGTEMQAVSRYGVFTKSPQTDIYAESYSGGSVAPVMKATGYDGFVLHGNADSPIYLVISEQGIEFRDASPFWGMETYETEDKILNEVGVEQAQALVIGPAGEKMVTFSGIANNYWRHAARAGVGAVMGSKKIKALVFYGDVETEIADKEVFASLVSGFVRTARDDQGVKNYRKYGTPHTVAVLNSYGAFATRYWQEGEKNNWENLSAKYMLEEMDAKPKACHQCLIACGKFTKVRKGKRKGLKMEGPEFETIYSFGGLCEIDKLEDVAYLNDICDRMGLDTISTGNIAGLVIEATERGLLDSNLQYGETDKIANLIEDIAYRRGLGDILARGIREAGQELGIEDLAIHVKGLEPAAYDPRVLKGMALAYATSPRGACHLRATVYKPELAGETDSNSIEDKSDFVKDYEDHHLIQDTAILCRFTRDLIDLELLSQLLSTATGFKYDERKLKDIAGNILTEIRNFNLQTGMSPADDTLPDRFFEDPLPPKNATLSRKELTTMVKEYYLARGWDEEGIPGK